MRKHLLVTCVTLLTLFSVALPVVAAGPIQQPSVDDGACVASTRSLPNGMYQVWVYCYNEGGYYPVGTAMHLVAAPLDHPSAEVWGDAVDLSGLPGDLLDGTYYVKENAISPVAVAAKTGRWEILTGWFFRLRDRFQSAASKMQTPAFETLGQVRLQNEKRFQMEDGRRVGEVTSNRFRIETRQHSESGGTVDPPAAPGGQGNSANNGNRGRR